MSVKTICSGGASSAAVSASSENTVGPPATSITRAGRKPRPRT